MDSDDDLDELAARVAAGADRQEQIDDLEERLRELAGVTAELAAKVLASPPPGRTWNWAEFDDQQRAAALAELRSWMKRILIRYPQIVDRLRPCFADHPYALDSLTAAYGTWRLAMSAKANAEQYAYWLDKWLSALGRQLDEALSGCKRNHVDDVVEVGNID